MDRKNFYFKVVQVFGEYDQILYLGLIQNSAWCNEEEFNYLFWAD